MSNFNNADFHKIKSLINVDTNLDDLANKGSSRNYSKNEESLLYNKDDVEVLDISSDIRQDKVLEVLDANFKKNRVVTQEFNQELYREIVLDVLAQNPGAIKLYQNLGFEQFTEVFKGFNNPNKEKPDVFSMKAELE